MPQQWNKIKNRGKQLENHGQKQTIRQQYEKHIGKPLQTIGKH